MFQKILLPLDNSSIGEQAVRYAGQVAAPDTSLYLLHVVPDREFRRAGS